MSITDVNPFTFTSGSPLINQTILNMESLNTNAIYNTFRVLNENKYLFSYTGGFNSNQASSILQFFKTYADNQQLETKYKKIIYTILVECVENIFKHSSTTFSNDHQGVLIIQKQHDNYAVLAGNFIDKETEVLLRDKLED